MCAAMANLPALSDVAGKSVRKGDSAAAEVMVPSLHLHKCLHFIVHPKSWDRVCECPPHRQHVCYVLSLSHLQL